MCMLVLISLLARGCRLAHLLDPAHPGCLPGGGLAPAARVDAEVAGVLTLVEHVLAGGRGRLLRALERRQVSAVACSAPTVGLQWQDRGLVAQLLPDEAAAI